MATLVNVDNFVRAETDRMFAALGGEAGGVNRWLHFREPTPIDRQTVIRMNRDTLYSVALVDAAEGATVTIPEAGRRYVSVMVVTQDHYVSRILHDSGEHRLKDDDLPTSYVLFGARVLVDPVDAEDVAAVNALQDGFGLDITSARPFRMPDYDRASLDTTRASLLELAKGLAGFERTFGGKEDVDPVRHLIGTAAGWGGLPEHEAYYINVDPGLPAGEYKLTVRDVPVDAFWSISLYNREGFFEANERGAYSINSITARPNDDRSITVHFGGSSDDRPNCLPIMDGWNYTVRMYRPHREALDGSWTFPTIETM